MVRRLRYLLVALVVAAASGAGLYWVGADPLLAAHAGFAAGAGVALTYYLARAYPGFETGDGWADTRWTSMGVLVAVVASGGVSTTGVPIAEQVGVALLVLGVTLTSYVAGMLSVLDRVADDQPASDAGSGTGAPTAGD